MGLNFAPFGGQNYGSGGDFGSIFGENGVQNPSKMVSKTTKMHESETQRRRVSVAHAYNSRANNFVGVWVRGCVSVWVCGFMDVWVCGRMGA